MKRWMFFIGIFISPLFLFAQLDKIHPEMSLAEFRAVFPKAVMDGTGAKERVLTTDSIYGASGLATYTFYRDTITQYSFTSDALSGPSQKYPGADTNGVSKIMAAARALYQELVLKFGAPSEKYSTSYLFPQKTTSETSVFGAKWRVKGGVIIIKVKEFDGDSSKDKNNKFHSGPTGFYYLNVEALSNTKSLSPQFNMGFSKSEFRKKYPAYSSKIEDA